MRRNWQSVVAFRLTRTQVIWQTKPFRILSLALVFILGGSNLLLAQTAYQLQPLANGDVIKMVQAGLSEATIATTVSSSRPEFDLTADGVAQLRQGRVSEEIIALMTKIAAAYAATNEAEKPAVDITSSLPTAPLVDNWQGLKIGTSTVEDVKAVLVKPKQEKDRQALSFLALGKYAEIEPAYKEKTFRILIFESFKDYDKISAVFQNNQLIALQFELKNRLDPNGLENWYGIRFRESWQELQELQREERRRDRTATAASVVHGGYAGLAARGIGGAFDSVFGGKTYVLFAQSVCCIVEAQAENESLFSKGPGNLGHLPGKVKKINYIIQKAIRKPDL